MNAHGAGSERCGVKEGAEYKYNQAAVTSAVDGYYLECVAEDITRCVEFDDIPVISVSDLLSLIIIQIH